MKQQKTTVLIALLTVVAYTLGHASVTVKDGWEEPIVEERIFMFCFYGKV